jgi:phosphoheptose isomerase
MTFFPEKIFEDVGLYLDSYATEMAKAYASIDRSQVQAAAECLKGAVAAGHTIFSCGNGGSCAIANHLVCDYLKGVQSGTDLKPRIVSLVSNLELITAVANDIAYDDIFSFQLPSLAKRGDVLIAITSSGASSNIIKALSWAGENGMHTIAMTGFGGSQARRIAHIALHVDATNYGIVEDVHQSLMHLLAQFLRQGALRDPTSIGHCKF